ncbi:hypothetical protein ACFQDF_15255 [Ectobacillus funiculus]
MFPRGDVRMPAKKTPDFIIVAVTLILLTVGMIMVYSASAAWASYKFQDSFFFCEAAAFICRAWCCSDVYHYED